MTEASLCDWLLAQGSIRHPMKAPIPNSVGFEKTGPFLGKLGRLRRRQYQVNDAGAERGWLPGCRRRDDRRHGGFAWLLPVAGGGRINFVWPFTPLREHP